MGSYSLSAAFIDRAPKPSWKGRRMQFVVAWPDRKDLWDRYIEQRKADHATGDRTARAASRFYLDQRTEMDAGAVTGNPRIRNRTTLLGRLQVGEFSMIVGLIKRAQSVLGSLFCVSGVMGLFRRQAARSDR